MAILVPQVGSEDNFSCSSMALQPDGRIVVAELGFRAKRFNADGSPDPHLASGVWRALRAYRVVAASNQ
jgi:hypothetical protein